MNKLLVSLALIASFAAMPTVGFAMGPPGGQGIQRVPAWRLVGSYVIHFDCATCVPHTITITSYNPFTGAFSGYGKYTVNPAFTWTVSGMVSGDQVVFRILYTGMDAGYYVDATGMIAANGTLSGSAVDSSGGRFDWVASGQVTVYATHGQFVAAQWDKSMAARSDFGMPIAAHR